MKKLFISIAAVFAAVCSLNAQQKDYAQMAITYAIIDGEDFSEKYAQEEAFLAFYKSEAGYFSMANVWTESQSYGPITDWFAYHHDATEDNPASDEFYFNWHYSNTYDDATGVASCCLFRVYSEEGVEYGFRYTLEDDTYAFYSGVMSGQIDEFINVLIETQGNGLFGVWTPQTVDIFNKEGALMAEIYPYNCGMLIAMAFKEDNKGAYFYSDDEEEKNGEFVYVYDAPSLYVSIDGEEYEFEYENGVLTCLSENDDVFMKVNFEKLPPMEDEEEEEEEAAVVLEVPEEPEVPEVITLDEVIQEGDEIEEEPIPFQLVEDKPLFMGGDANQFSKWVNERLVYPDIAKENGVQGRVVLQFTVAKDGSIKNIRVLRGVDPALDNEAVRVVSMSPAWTPGMQRGRVVPVTYTFPVIFKLN